MAERRQVERICILCGESPVKPYLRGELGPLIKRLTLRAASTRNVGIHTPLDVRQDSWLYGLKLLRNLVPDPLLHFDSFLTQD